MKYIYLAVSTILLACWIIFGNYAGPAGLPVPALGQFFHPAKGFWRNTLPQLSERNGGHEVNIDHPQAKGSIFFDERGVPHIFSDDLADVLASCRDTSMPQTGCGKWTSAPGLQKGG